MKSLKDNAVWQCGSGCNCGKLEELKPTVEQHLARAKQLQQSFDSKGSSS